MKRDDVANKIKGFIQVIGATYHFCFRLLNKSAIKLISIRFRTYILKVLCFFVRVFYITGFNKLFPTCVAAEIQVLTVDM